MAVIKRPRLVRVTAEMRIQDLEAAELLTGLTFDENWEPDLIVVEPEPEPCFFSHFAKEVDGGKRYFRSFASVRDFCEQPFANSKNLELFLAEQNGGKFHNMDLPFSAGKPPKTNLVWFGAKDAATAMEHAIRGWPEGGDRVRRMMDAVDVPAPVSLRRRTVRADQGDELDIHAVYRGGLDQAWSRRQRRATRSRMTVRLAAQIGGSKHMTAEEMFWRGAAVVKLVELLEESSYRVELIGVDFHGKMDPDDLKHPHTSGYASFCVKEAGAPLDIEQVAGVLCNAGFFRTYGFRGSYAIVEHDIRPTQVIATGIGKWKTVRFISRCYVGWDDIVEIGNLDADGTPTFAVPTSIDDRATATSWVLDTLNKLQGDVK